MQPVTLLCILDWQRKKKRKKGKGKTAIKDTIETTGNFGNK